jgi:hypothetical protein
VLRQDLGWEVMEIQLDHRSWNVQSLRKLFVAMLPLVDLQKLIYFFIQKHLKLFNFYKTHLLWCCRSHLHY